MSEEEILFNKLHDIFKNNISNKSTRAVIESAEFINVNKEKISLEHTNIKGEFISWVN